MKKGIKTFCKVLSVFLAVLFVIEILPLHVMAEEFTDAVAQKEFIEDLVNNPTDAEKDAESEILYEVEEKRDEHTKVYKKSDGTYTAVMTEEPLHYLDEGVWKEIDNSMILNGNIYTNLNNLFNVELPKNIDGNKELTVEKDGYELSFSIDDVKNSSAVVENNIVTSDTEIADADSAISQTQSSVTYNDIADNTDLQYIVTPNSIKENIIVSNKESVKDTYTFTFETNGLTAEKQDDGSIIFKNNNGDVKFKIPCPVMTDANFEFSYDIGVSLTENADDTVTLEYIPSIDWTSSSDRVYPITIDPAITVDGEESSFIEDTFVEYDKTKPNLAEQNHANDSLAIITNIPTKGEIDKSIKDIESKLYTKIDTNFFKNLGSDIVFTEVQYIIAGVTTTDGKLFAREITGDWDVNTVTYNTKPKLSSEIIDYYTSPLPEGEEFDDFAYVHFNITKVFNEWFNGKINNGFAITAAENTMSIMIANGGSNNTAMVMDYVDLGGYNENLNYHSQSAGRAGTGYVNDFTQSLSVIRDDIYIEGNPLPVTVGMTYNSATYSKLASLNYTNMMAYGNKWIPTYLRAYLYNDENYVTYYTDAGSTIDFVRSTDSFGNVIFTESYSDIYGTHGYEIEYYPASDGNKAYYTVSRPDGYVERFNNNGLLTSITNPDIDEQSILITYDSMYRIDCIMDYGGNKYKYTYNDRNLLSKIENYVYWSTEKPIAETCYIYDGNNLISVTSYDGELIEYEYDEYGNITSMTHKNNFRIKYEYDANGRVVKVTEQDYDGTNYVDGNIIFYDRLSTTQIKVTDKNSDKIYQFNNKGNLLYTTDNTQPNQSTITSGNNYITNGDFKNELEDWTINNYDISPSTINQNGITALELPAEVDVDCTVSQTITIDGKKNDTIAVAGWLKGNFTKSSTNNVWLRNLIEESEDPKICNFTNDRYAQIEVSYQYTETNEDGVEETLSETTVVPFTENLDEWQYASGGFTLKGDCETVTILVRYSNNANSALLSNIELIKNDGYELKCDDGQLVGLSLGLRDVISYTYNDNDKISNIVYNNNAYQKTTTEFEYNVNNKLTQIKENGKKKYSFEYEDNNITLKKILSSDNRIIRYVDDFGGLSSFTNSYFYSIKNEDGNPVQIFDEKEYKTQLHDVDYNIYGTSIEKSEVLVENNKAIGINSTQDWYGRRSNNIVESKNNLVKIESQYGYDENAGFETLNQVVTYTNAIHSTTQTNYNLSQNHSFSYEYDDNGNIIKEYDYVSENSMELRYSYAYDSDNRLIRYNDNVLTPNRSYSFEYDSDGNLLSKSTYTYTPLETELGEPISTEYYNDIPTLFDDATLTWNGKQLESYERTDDNTNITTRVEYSYDENSLMTEKKVYIDNILNETYNYIWTYGKLNTQVYTNEVTSTKHTIKYVYDSFNSVQGFILNHTETYLYLKNLQGDIVGIVDESGNTVFSYEYDVWGVPTITCNYDESTLANIVETLPLAYRGCCYDYATGLYYVENRYYNPETGRFINASGTEENGLLETTSNYSIFTYWENHPLWYSDYNANETFRANSIANYLYNQQITSDASNYFESTNGFIFNQMHKRISGHRYGFNAVGPYGCGLVATYNALLLLENQPESQNVIPMNFYDVIREYEQSGLLAYGCWGLHPLAIAQFFIKRNYDVNIIFNDFNDIVDNENIENIINIMFYLHNTGNHYVAIEYNDGSFKGYNTFCENSLVPDDLEKSIATLEHGNNTYQGRILISISKK